ncbi:MAG TPA: 30S ribosomal protein S15 [bacterium]|nr:30S ribosomal protein S15 [bacterium]
MLIKEEKEKIVKGFKLAEKDTGSPEVQVALLSRRIEQLTDHLKTHSKDLHSRHGLLKMVAQRRRLLKYMRSISSNRYKKIISELKIREI